MYPVLFRLGSFEITSFGVMVALGAALGILMLRRELIRSGVDGAKGVDAALVGVLGGLAGAKLLYVAEHWAEPISSTLLSRGGMSWFGGLTGGVLAGLAMVAWQRLPLMAVLSAAAPALTLGHAVGRIGCFLVGDDYGRPTTLPWGIAFPDGLPPTTDRVHPTQLYEAFALFALTGVLLALRRRGARDRAVFGAYLMAAGTPAVPDRAGSRERRGRSGDDDGAAVLGGAVVAGAALLAAGGALTRRSARRRQAAGASDGAGGQRTADRSPVTSSDRTGASGERPICAFSWSEQLLDLVALRVGRVRGQQLLPRLHRACQVLLAVALHDSEVEQRLRVCRVDRQRLVELRDRLVRPARVPERRAEVGAEVDVPASRPRMPAGTARRPRRTGRRRSSRWPSCVFAWTFVGIAGEDVPERLHLLFVHEAGLRAAGGDGRGSDGRRVPRPARRPLARRR